MNFKTVIKITAFILLCQGWMPYFVDSGGAEYIERFFKLLAVYLCLSYYEQTKVEDRIEAAVSMLLMGLCISNLIDELFLNPLIFSWNEIAGAIVACFLSYFEYKGWFKLIKVKLLPKSK